MVQTITDYVGFLAQARQAVEELSLLRDREEKLGQEERRLERELEAHKKHINDTIQQTTRKRLEEVSSSYDKEIAGDQERLKKARQKREKAKNQGVHARIKEETEELHAHNSELKTQMKTLFQQGHVPSFCKSGFYFSLYFPRRFKEFLCFFLWLALCFGAIPGGVYYLIPEHRPLYLALIYVLTILIFGGAYVLVGNKTKLRHMEALKEGRKIRDIIQSNQKKIRVITTSIRRDRDEARYNLEKFDDEIARIEQELLEITNKKKDAVNTFEQVTKTIISDEIETNNRARLEELQTGFESVSKDLREAQTQIKEKTLEVTDRYEPYLGKEFLDALKISELSSFIQNKSAENLTEAMDIYRQNKKQ